MTKAYSGVVYDIYSLVSSSSSLSIEDLDWMIIIAMFKYLDRQIKVHLDSERAKKAELEALLVVKRA